MRSRCAGEHLFLSILYSYSNLRVYIHAVEDINTIIASYYIYVCHVEGHNCGLPHGMLTKLVTGPEKTGLIYTLNFGFYFKCNISS